MFYNRQLHIAPLQRDPGRGTTFISARESKRGESPLVSKVLKVELDRASQTETQSADI